MEQIKIYLIEMPPRVHAFTVYEVESDGEYYTILINSRLSDQMQCEAYDHEILHINNHDFDHMYHVDALEAFRHAI